jgi:putative ABC transport system permease protein
VSGKPPRLAAWLARLATPPQDREPLLGDLEEEFRSLAEENGRARARSFYWSQVLRSLGPSLARRLHALADQDALPHPRLPLRGGLVLDLIRLDLRLAVRTLRRHPRLFATAVLTLAVGIAANTAMFAVVDGIVLRPFPFPDPERLVTIGTEIPRTRQELSFFENLSPAEYLDIARECRTLERVVAWDMGNRQVARDGPPENLFSAFFWGDAFATLGVRPATGRGFTADEIRKGERVAIVSHRYWSSRLASDPSLVGQRLLVNGEPYTLVGVMPPGTLLYGTDLWLPMPVGPEVYPRGRRQFQVLARIASGQTREAVNAELRMLVDRLAAAHAAELPEYVGMRLVAYTWTDANVRTLRPAAALLLGAAGFVLVLACANVASLLLARAAGRRREMAVRYALGAGRWAVVRQLLSESLILALAGGMAGTLLARLAVRSLSVTLARLRLPLATDDLQLSGASLAYALGASLIAALAFGLAPAISASRFAPSAPLRAEGGSVTAGGVRLRAGRLLVGLEIGAAAVLLVACGLLLRSLDRLQRVDPGLAAADIVGFRVTLPQERYGSAARMRFFQELQDRVARLPGVVGATVVDQYPPIAFSRTRLRILGEEPRGDDDLPAALLTGVTPAYLGTVGGRLLSGRFLSEDDAPGRLLVAVVNQTAAARHFGGSGAVGRAFEIVTGGGAVRAEVVGLVADTHNRGLDRGADPEVFVSLLQNPDPANQYFVLVRARAEPLSLVPALRAQVTSLDPEQPIYGVQTVEQALESQGMPRRVASSLLLVLTAVAVVLAGTGVYAVVSHAAAARTRELGVRIALGARRAQVRGLVVRQALLPASVGGALGLGAAVFLARGLGGLLFGIRPFDPLTIAGAGALLLLLAAAASDAPARRASRLDPVAALREE